MSDIRLFRTIGDWGAGALAIHLVNQADLQKALPLLQSSYEGA